MPGRRRAAGFAVAGSVFVLLSVLAVSTLPGMRSAPDFVPLIDGWVQGMAYVAVAALCLLALGRPHTSRALWGWITVALTCRAVGFVLFLTVVRREDPRPYPSVADVFWVATYGFMMVALVIASRRRLPRPRLPMALDGITGALATVAVATAVLSGTVADRVRHQALTPAVVTDVAYPVLDVMLLLTVLGVLLTWAWQPFLPVWALSFALVSFAVTDIVFLVTAASDEFESGGWLAPIALASSALIAGAAWIPDTRGERVTRGALPSLVLPGLFAVACLGVLIYASENRVTSTAVVLAAIGLVVAIGRTTLAFLTVRELARHRAEARTDDLTGLANRRAFHERLAQMLTGRPAENPAALLVLDLDDFKAVNDTLGHHYGDDLLRQVAVRLLDGLRDDDLLARIGGDEFAIVLDGSDRSRATQVAERLEVGLRRPFSIASRELDVSLSIGIAAFPGDASEPMELLQRADLAMYDAKSRRTGHSVYRPESHHADLARLESVDRLRYGIQNGEIVLHYQPVVDLVTGTVRGVEALARWNRPGEPLVQPGGFLPLAERGGLMRLLTMEVLEQAVRRAAQWRAESIGVTVAVNMSVTNLLDVGFPDQLVRMLDEAGVPGEAIQLELTEDLFMADPARARQVIAALLRTGVRLAVDDYGTGFSSLSYLRDLHEISGLKLDRTFITHVDSDDRAAAIVASTVTLAQSLGLTVVAEGVETRAARDRLAELGCELAQGFFFSRPVPVDALRFDLMHNARAAP